jgi:hypothetical protein
MALNSYPMTPEVVSDFQRESKQLDYFGHLITVQASKHVSNTDGFPQMADLEVVEEGVGVVAYISTYSDHECAFFRPGELGVTVGHVSDNLSDGLKPILNE